MGLCASTAFVSSFPGPSGGNVRCCAEHSTADSKTRLVAVSYGQDIWLFDLTTGERRGRGFRVPDGVADSLSFDASGKRLVAVGGGSTLAHVFNVADGLKSGEEPIEPASSLEHDSAVTCVRFSPADDTRLFICGTQGGQAVAWNVEDGQVLYKLERHTDAVVAVVVSPAGNMIVTASVDSDLILWDALTGTYARSLKRHKHPLSRSLEFSSDGERLISLDTSGKCFVWSIMGGGEVAVIGEVPVGDDAGSSQASAGAFAPANPRVFMLGSSAGVIDLYSSNKGAHIAPVGKRKKKSPVRVMHVTSQNELLFAHQGDSALRATHLSHVEELHAHFS